MATFISLVNFTEQGIRGIKESPDRYAAFKATAEKAGVSVKGIYYTAGRYDMALVCEGTEEAVATALLKLASQGNVRSETLRGFSLDEMRKIVTGIA